MCAILLSEEDVVYVRPGKDSFSDQTAVTMKLEIFTLLTSAPEGVASLLIYMKPMAC